MHTKGQRSNKFFLDRRSSKLKNAVCIRNGVALRVKEPPFEILVQFALRREVEKVEPRSVLLGPWPVC
jgi:hypothetical protein